MGFPIHLLCAKATVYRPSSLMSAVVNLQLFRSRHLLTAFLPSFCRNCSFLTIPDPSTISEARGVAIRIKKNLLLMTVLKMLHDYSKTGDKTDNNPEPVPHETSTQMGKHLLGAKPTLCFCLRCSTLSTPTTLLPKGPEKLSGSSVMA